MLTSGKQYQAGSTKFTRKLVSLEPPKQSRDVAVMEEVALLPREQLINATCYPIMWSLFTLFSSIHQLHLDCFTWTAPLNRTQYGLSVLYRCKQCNCHYQKIFADFCCWVSQLCYKTAWQRLWLASSWQHRRTKIACHNNSFANRLLAACCRLWF